MHGFLNLNKLIKIIFDFKVLNLLFSFQFGISHFGPWKQNITNFNNLTEELQVQKEDNTSKF